MNKYQYLRSTFADMFQGHDYRSMYEEFEDIVWPLLCRLEFLEQEYASVVERKEVHVNHIVDTLARVRVWKYAARKKYREVFKLHKRITDLEQREKEAKEAAVDMAERAQYLSGELDFHFGFKRNDETQRLAAETLRKFGGE